MAAGFEKPNPINVQTLWMDPMFQNPCASEGLSGITTPIVLNETLHKLSSFSKANEPCLMLFHHAKRIASLQVIMLH